MATGGGNRTSRTRNPGSPSSTPNSKRSPQISVKESSPCRPSERLNPKTIDPVSVLYVLICKFEHSNNLMCKMTHVRIQMINHDRMYLFIYSLKTVLENNQHLQQCIVMVEFHAGSQACVTYSLGHSRKHP